MNTRSIKPVPTNTFSMVDERMSDTYAQRRYSVIYMGVNGQEEVHKSGIASIEDAEKEKIHCMDQFRTDHGYVNPDDFAVIRM